MTAYNGAAGLSETAPPLSPANWGHIFGVRHLSPGTAWHLKRLLEEIKPDCVLIEGPADATPLLPQLTAKGVVPPVALLAYTTELPIETVLYPFAAYSPEYQAALWAAKHKREVRFIDLPAEIMLGLRQKPADAPDEAAETEEATETGESAADFHRFHNRLYDLLAARSLPGIEDDYESYWERNFEHNLQPGSLRVALALQSAQLRELVIEREQAAAPREFAYNLVREAHMRREVRRAINEGFRPEKILILVGAYHVASLGPDVEGLEPMSDQELAAIPRAPVNLTLMPYSYHRLSSRTGYGAGNRAPHYFELMWQAMNRGESLSESPDISALPGLYLSLIARELRAKGHNASTASAIEAARLALALASLRNGSLPVLRDLHDAAATCFGHGSLSVVAEALNLADIGTAIGSLPEGAGQTPVQQDMARELKRLKLEPYKAGLPQDLELDLRENRRAKSEESAFLDLNRSTFLHRLGALGISFAKKARVTQEKASFTEKWVLQWTPESEIELVEANLKGESLEIAAAYQLREQLNDCRDLALAAQIIRQACECDLARIFDNALGTLQALLVEAGSFRETAQAARELSLLVQYGDIRRFDLEPLKPILQQLFLRAALLLQDAAACDDKAALENARALNVMELVSQEQYDLVDTETWQAELQKLAWRDDLNARLSGAAFALLLEHNLANEEDCAREVSRRLSPGVPADLGAGWLEGLSGRNRYALLSRVSLWKELDLYVRSLDDAEFARAVVFLRRAFGEFEPNQKNSVAELLGELWGTGAEATAEKLQAELTEAESGKLDELNDFDFDF